MPAPTPEQMITLGGGVVAILAFAAILVRLWRLDRGDEAYRRRWRDGPGLPDPKTFEEVIKAETVAGMIPDDDDSQDCA